MPKFNLTPYSYVQISVGKFSMLQIQSLCFQLDVIKYCQNEIKQLLAAHKSIQIIFCQLEVGQRVCRGVEVMLTLSYTALNSSCCPEIGQWGSNCQTEGTAQATWCSCRQRAIWRMLNQPATPTADWFFLLLNFPMFCLSHKQVSS